MDFDIKYLFPASCMVVLLWEILFTHYFLFTLMFSPFTLFSMLTRTSFNKLLLMYLLQSLTTMSLKLWS